jgi:hypothetical protein
MITPEHDLRLAEAIESWGSGRGETTEWGRYCLMALFQGQLSCQDVAQAVYSRLKPVDAHGQQAMPKMRHGRMSVRSLENTSLPVKGAAAARKSLEAVLAIYEAKDLISPEIDTFLAGKGKLFGLWAVARRRTGSRRATHPR